MKYHVQWNTPNHSVLRTSRIHFPAVNYKAYETQACRRSPHLSCPINRSHLLPQALQWALKYEVISVAVYSTNSGQRLSKQHGKPSHFQTIYPHLCISTGTRGACFFFSLHMDLIASPELPVSQLIDTNSINVWLGGSDIALSRPYVDAAELVQTTRSQTTLRQANTICSAVNKINNSTGKPTALFRLKQLVFKE